MMFATATTTSGSVAHQLLIWALIMAGMTVASGSILVMRRFTTRTFDRALGTDLASRQRRVFYEVAHQRGYIYAIEGLVVLTFLLFLTSAIAVLVGA